jgi:transcriptional regulator with XRE-family HTH domain
MSQPALAAAARVPVATLRNWEQDRREPKLYTAARVAEALGVSLDELVGEVSATKAAAKSARPRKGK